MSAVTYQWEGGGVVRLAAAARNTLGSNKARAAFRRGINRTGDKTFTIVRRVVAKQVGLSQSKVTKKGGLQRIRANYQALEYLIISRGGFISLKEFKARQVRRGVSAAPWGKRQVFKSAFGPRIGALGGHVFHRTSADRFPIEKMWGPAVPKEIVKDESRKAFDETAARELPPKIEHEIRRLMQGTAS
ncbi:minor tail protein Z (GPZ) [Breoghania corrubedonensis]|uniref:Minor tail protein Z (GPZ) n=1 Tax=Breoghania corrubedonensis TaxID=665038 RepID=A0A2T5UQW4_9HYPH|nr:phage tail protein [Breoghania corrubedonensis]PTW53907.1 minor tail protein Z (GPZ) [Breoghania corrubedonensis]